MFISVFSQPTLDSIEQEAVYNLLDSINPEVPWRSVFPDDLCSSAPHGVVCEFFDDKTTVSAHITELSFGYISDYSPNQPCTPHSTLDPSLFSSFSHLKKLFFYKCFTETSVPLPDFSSLRPSIEQLVFIENPSLFGSLSGKVGNLTSLRRLVLTGTNVYGKIPDGLGDLINLEQITISRNKFSGEISISFEKLNKLKVLDLSQNGFQGNVPGSLGNGSTELLKLDLSFNAFSGKIPENLKCLKNLVFLDLSYNRFSNLGLPSFLGEMPSLKEVYLTGNLLGGRLPERWENLRGILAMGLSGNGLVGNIPAFLGVNLRNISYLGLGNNKLEGTVPEEFGLLESLRELNLENNNLSGKVPFSAEFVAKIGNKLKLEGNPELCADEELRSRLRKLKQCDKPDIPKSALLHGNSPHRSSAILLMLIAIGFAFLLLL